MLKVVVCGFAFAMAMAAVPRPVDHSRKPARRRKLRRHDHVADAGSDEKEDSAKLEYGGKKTQYGN